MKIDFNLKLGIGIVVVFGLLFAGYLLYEPLWLKVQSWRLMSDNAGTRESAAKALAGKGERIIPFVKKWLKFQNDKYVIGACHVLENMPGNTWRKALEEGDRLVLTINSSTSKGMEIILLHDGKSAIRRKGKDRKVHFRKCHDDEVISGIWQNAFCAFRTCVNERYDIGGMDEGKLEIYIGRHNRCYILSNSTKDDNVPSELFGAVLGLSGLYDW
jgi:hypothetical protein